MKWTSSKEYVDLLSRLQQRLLQEREASCVDFGLSQRRRLTTSA
jgi:hypothetical protein